MKKLLVLFAIFHITIISFSQICIDWQQCYGSKGVDEIHSMTQINGNYIIVGRYGTDDGMVTCESTAFKGWIIEIDTTGELTRQYCINANIKERPRVYGNETDFYLIGLKENELGKDAIYIARVNEYNEVLWERFLSCGDDHPGFWDLPFGKATPDGGVIMTAIIYGSGGDISHSYGGKDAWVVKLDGAGNMEWETTIGTENTEFPSAIINTSDSNYMLAVYGNPGNNGSIPGCNMPYWDESDAVTVKLDNNGNVLNSQCYGGSKGDSFTYILELSDGFLVAGASRSDDGDLEGAGYHLGYIYDYPPSPQTMDIWLLRTDLDGNIIWSKCYGGTNNEFSIKVFQNEDGGFTVFGISESIDGDVQSMNNLIPPIIIIPPIPMNGQKMWVFRVDSAGNLLWERAIGHTGNTHIYLNDVIKHNDREYTIAGQSWCNNGDIPSGDYNCSNDTLPALYGSVSNIWVLHITDIVDYDTLDIKEMSSQNEAVQIYPNPAGNFITISGNTLQKVEILNLTGQLVASLQTKGNTLNMDIANIPAGLYFVKVTEAKGKQYVKKIVKK